MVGAYPRYATDANGNVVGLIGPDGKLMGATPVAAASATVMAETPSATTTAAPPVAAVVPPVANAPEAAQATANVDMPQTDSAKVAESAAELAATEAALLPLEI